MSRQTGPEFTTNSAGIAVRSNAWPILYEDDKEADLGEANLHFSANVILYVCLNSHFAADPQYQVFGDMNLYYQPPDSDDVSPLPYVSPDTMVVKPLELLPKSIRSYQIGKHGPAPLVTIEILSQRSWEQFDLDEKVKLYAKLGVAEYILIDIAGSFLPHSLLLKRLQSDRTWKDQVDADGGVTSQLGFRLTIEQDGELRVINAVTNESYPRPIEAVDELREAKKELARLRQLLQKKSDS